MRSAAAAVESSSERNHWSARNPIWRKYRVPKPRIPTEDDKHRQWTEAHIPATLLGFVGPTATAALRLRGVVDGYKARHTTPNMLLEGPSGSGKTALIKCFVGELKAAFGARGREKCGVLVIPAKTAAPTTIEQAVEELFATKSGYKLVVLDEIDSVPTTTQQALLKAVSKSKQTKLLFSCATASKVISQFREKCNRIQLQLLPEKEALTVVLGVLKAERVGYERQGIQLLFERAKERNLSKLIPLLQDIFVVDYFLSEINMQRRLMEGRKRKKPTLMSYSALPEPFDRCEKCTLVPPCQHISWEDLHEMGMEIRGRLPRYEGGMACQEFIKTGRCSLFLKYGHCSLDHPTNYHIVLGPVRRCPSCTLPWPCNHCNYALERNQLQAYVQACHDALRILDMKSLQLSLRIENSTNRTSSIDHRQRHRTKASAVPEHSRTSVQSDSHQGEFSHLRQLVDEISHTVEGSRFGDTATTHSSTRLHQASGTAMSRSVERQKSSSMAQDDFNKDLLVSLRVREAIAQLQQVTEWLAGEMSTDANTYATQHTALRDTFEPILSFVGSLGDVEPKELASTGLDGIQRSQSASWIESSL